MIVRIDGVADEHPYGQIESNRQCAARLAELMDRGSREMLNDDHILSAGYFLMGIVAQSAHSGSEITIRITPHESEGNPE